MVTNGPLVEAQAGELAGAGGLRLFYRCWRGGVIGAATTPRAAVIDVHGIGAHSGMAGLSGVPEYLAARGDAVYAPDLRGHGRSTGARGHAGSWAELREDLGVVVALVQREEPGVPVFLVGTSLGGLIVLDYALHHPEGLSGVITIAPALVVTGVSPVLKAVARVMSRVWPTFSLELKLDQAAVSRDPAVMPRMMADPLWHNRASVRLGSDAQATMQSTMDGAAELAPPLLMLHGTADRINAIEGTRQFFARVAGTDKELREYEGGYHVLQWDIDAQQVLADIDDWVRCHAVADLPPSADRSIR